MVDPSEGFLSVSVGCLEAGRTLAVADPSTQAEDRLAAFLASEKEVPHQALVADSYSYPLAVHRASRVLVSIVLRQP